MRSLLTGILALIACTLLSWHWAGRMQLTQQVILDNRSPTYQMQGIVTILYEPTGQLSYQVAAERVQYYTHRKTSDFEQPHMILFDVNSRATWIARARKAELTAQHLLYLKGDIEINAVAAEVPLQRLQTQQARINLNDQTIVLEHPVTLYGLRGITIANKAQGNLRQQQFTLSDGVDSYYDMAQ